MGFSSSGSPAPSLVVDSTSPPPMVGGIGPSPLASPRLPPPPIVPPASSVPSPVTSPPLPAVSPVTSPSPVGAVPIPSPPSVLQLPPPPVVTPPPRSSTNPSTPVSSSLPLPAQPPTRSVAPPSFPTSSLAPTSSPPRPPIPPSLSPPAPTLPPPAIPPVSSPPPPATPPVTSPPPLIPPSAPPETSPPPPGTPRTVLPSPEKPSNPTPKTPPPPTPPSSSISISPPRSSLPSGTKGLPVVPKQDHLPTGLIIGCLVAGAFLVFLVLGLLYIFCQDKKKKNHEKPEDIGKESCFIPPQDSSKNKLPQHHQQRRSPRPSSRGYYSMNSGSGNVLPLPPPPAHVALHVSTGTFKYDELLAATDGFSEVNLIGQGGFGYVYKGYLHSGKEVAVKRLKEGSKQREREFQAEVEIISRVHHKHLVSLLGYCISGAERLLVYEFVSNNTLEFHLHGNKQPVMDWATRLKIAIGSAKGLAYLHEDCSPKIIHRDIKAANILLDYNFEAKVSDFGLAKRFSDASPTTSITTKVVGTFGYLAPEYASSGKVTEKSDVYSYGVVLLELITGHPPIGTSEPEMKRGIVEWAKPLLNQALQDGNFEALVDQRLEYNYNINEMTSMIACAASSVRHSAWLRPQMSQIVRALEGDISAKDLIEGTRPGHSMYYGSLTSSNFESKQYKEDISKFNKALASGQFSTNELSGSTSNYGLNLSPSSSEASCS